MLNNPIRYSDPSGHRDSGECGPGENCDRKKRPSSWEEVKKNKINDEDNDDKSIQNPIIQPLPTSTPTPSYYYQPGPTRTPTKIPEIRSTSYNSKPDAYIIGVGGAISLPPRNSLLFGIETVSLQKDKIGTDRTGVFVYAGGGSSYGVGGNASIYAGYINNMENLQDYEGPVGSIGGTLSIKELGLTVSHFGNEKVKNLPSGMIYGWAPGARFSLGNSTTTYWRIP